MTPAAAASPEADVAHFFTVDVEEYFQVNAFEHVVTRETWERWPRRLNESMPRLLDALERVDARGTFFVLGWIAERDPALVRRIADRGHEVASHGYWHRRVVTLTPGMFREDVRASVRALEDAAGTAVRGYRAPSFSILPGYEWAFDILIEEGFTYDSSVFPIRRAGYGNPGAPRTPYVVRRPAGVLTEFPLATTTLFGVVVPAAGGGYLRQFPYALIDRAFAEATARRIPATFYVHPWELDPAQPRLPVSWLTRVRHYRGLARTLPCIERLLNTYSFTSIGAYLDAQRNGTMTDGTPSRATRA